MSAEQATGHEAAAHPGDSADEAHGADDHGEDHGRDDDGHASEALGPVDVLAWGAFLLGSGLGLAVALTIALATS